MPALNVRMAKFTASALVCALALGACAIPAIPARIVYETPTDFVRLEADPYAFHEVTQTLHSHPADIEVEEMARLLKGLSVQEYRNVLQQWFGGKAKLEPVFRDEEIAWLAPRLSQALTGARSGTNRNLQSSLDMLAPSSSDALTLCALTQASSSALTALAVWSSVVAGSPRFVTA